MDVQTAIEKQELIDLAKGLGASNAAVIEVAQIPFLPEFRDACAQNFCGKYGTCWMCPPDVGDIHEMIADAKTYQHAFVFQSIGALEDSYDFEGMQEVGDRHNQLTIELAKRLKEVLSNPLKLGAGACRVCEECTRPQNMPCRHPEEAIASLESYGIAVYQLAPLCGMNYINGQNTVTYFGALLYK